MITLTKQQIDRALPRIKTGLEKYLWIQNEVHKRNVSSDKEFQRKFNHFYRLIPHRNKEWQKEFYSLFQKSKKSNLDFKDILLSIYKRTGRLEASFASKLKATLDPKMPVIDSIVLKNLKLKLHYSYENNRDSKIDFIYQILIKELASFLKTEQGKYLVKQFIKEYPKVKITKVKMLDFVLWQTRN